MPATLIPLVFALIVLFVHGLYAGTLRRNLHLALDALPQVLRDALDWPDEPKGLGQSDAYAERRAATNRLACWSLPVSTKIPDTVYAMERLYRRHMMIENGLLVVVIGAFALAHEQAWIVSIVLLAGFLAVNRFRKSFVEGWPEPDRVETRSNP